MVTCQYNFNCKYGEECRAGICQPFKLGEACDTRNECKGGYACESSGSDCISRCLRAEDCQAGYTCLQNGQCSKIPSCSSNENCPTGYGCEIDTNTCLLQCQGSCEDDNLECRGGLCRPSLLCSNGKNCPDGYKCIDASCRKACSGGSNACPSSGMVCVEGSCLPKCGSDSDCPAGGVCAKTKGICGKRCTNTIDCLTGFECTQSACVPTSASGNEAECLQHSDCRHGFLCNLLTRKCLRSCSDPHHCKPGFSCQQGRCVALVPVNPCSASNPCKHGYACRNGTCAERCDGTGGCRGQFQCSLLTGRCYVSGAFGNVECLVDEECKGYACDYEKRTCTKSCQSDRECGPYFYCDIRVQKCVALTGKSCQVDGDCEAGYACLSSSGCYFRCDDNTHCKKGYWCQEGRCEPIVEHKCNVFASCPGNFKCSNGVCLIQCVRNADCTSTSACVGKQCR